ncbi:MAG: hypothetical protein ABEJ24_01755 [Candidatus Magasanikbacteria bacterium]
MKIAICSSMKFIEEMGDAREKLKRDGHEVVLPHNTESYISGELDPAQEETVKNKIENDLFKHYYEVIDESDAKETTAW